MKEIKKQKHSRRKIANFNISESKEIITKKDNVQYQMTSDNKKK